jgi:hypothetical protein
LPVWLGLPAPWQGVIAEFIPLFCLKTPPSRVRQSATFTLLKHFRVAPRYRSLFPPEAGIRPLQIFPKKVCRKNFYSYAVRCHWQ